MAIVTNSDVFEFCGTPSDVQTTQGTAITNLISRVTEEVEAIHGKGAVVYGNCLWLKGPLRDLHTITSITETGTSLTESTEYNDGGDFYLDTQKGLLIKINDIWSKEHIAFKLTGDVCIGFGSGLMYGSTARGDIKQAIIEMVAAKSGLWKNNVMTEGGSIETIRTTPRKETMVTLKKYRLRDF
jgi:hypothetical protein